MRGDHRRDDVGTVVKAVQEIKHERERDEKDDGVGEIENQKGLSIWQARNSETRFLVACACNAP